MNSTKGLPFSTINRLCEQNLEKRYISDCIRHIKNEDCLYNPGIIMPYEHMLSLYSLRLKIAKSNISDIDYISNYEQIIENMKAFKSDYIGLAALYSEVFSYLIFYEPDKETILGILRTKSKQTLAEIAHHNSEIVHQGLSSEMVRYSKGTFVQSWSSKP